MDNLAKEMTAFDASEFRVAVWEVLSQISIPHCPQNSITEGMDQHISIGVSVQSFLKRDLHTPENEFSAPSQRVDVVPPTDSHWPLSGLR